jgi:hypothetical protein
MKLSGGKTLASAQTGPCVRAVELSSARTRVRPRGQAQASVQTRGHRPVRADELTSLPSPSLCNPSLALHGRAVVSVRTSENKIIIIIIIYFILFFKIFGCCKKEEKKCLVFGFQFPRSRRSPGFAGEAARRRRFFWPSSPSHPSKLYSSLGWLNSKVPKPFFPFTPRLIDVDGF